MWRDMPAAAGRRAPSRGGGALAAVAPPQRRSRSAAATVYAALGLWAAAVVAASCRAASGAGRAASGSPGSAASFVAWTQAPAGLRGAAAPPPRQWGLASLARGSGAVLGSIKNPVKTVSETIDEFYKEYPQPPVLPMYRAFLVDLLTQTHLTVVDQRFKYDAIFALGLWEYYTGLMGSYDKMVGGSDQASKIWKAMAKAVGFDGDKLKADAEAVQAYAKSTAPSQILQQMEGTQAAPDKRIADAFAGISKSLYSQSFSIGLFKLMELTGIEISKANVEEWAKALKIVPAKATSDLETYKQNKSKLQKAEEMLREVEIREKKKLAERLEEKAKALAAKAAEKAAAAKAAKEA